MTFSNRAGPELKPDWYMRGRLRLRHLRLLVVLDAVHNLSSAASLLSTTQPAVSKMLMEIEEMVGAPLFNRTPNGTFATAHGEILVRHAAWVLGDLDRIGADLAAVDKAVEKIQLGANSTSAAFLIPSAILAFQRAMPNGEVALHEGSVESLIPGLRTRQLDLVVARLGAASRAEDLVEHHLFDEPMAVTCSVNHPLAKQKTCTWKHLADYAWVLPPRGSPVRDGLDMLFKKNRVTPAAYVESASILSNVVMMDEGNLLSVVPRSLALHYAKRGLFHMLPIRLPLVFGPLGIIMHRSLDQTPALRLLIQCIRDAAPSPKRPARDNG